MVDEVPHAEGVEHRYVEANGIRIHLAGARPSDSSTPPILLLHGWPQHWYMWRRVIAALHTERQLLAPDLRGFGWSEAPGYGYDGETFAADQIALLDALGIERADLIGHDWGGWTAMLLGIQHPDRVRRMVVCNAPHPFVRPAPALLAEAWRAWYTWVIATPVLGPHSLRHGWISRTILTHGNVRLPFSGEEIAMYADSFREPARAEASSRLYRYYQRAFGEAAAGRWRGARLRAPTLLLFGERDLYITPKLLGGHERHTDDMRVELVPDSGHFLVDEKPELVIERVREFLAA